MDAAAAYGPALERLARGYEADGEKRRDLLQEIHFQLWRSFRSFDARCSMRTWIYRVAHNCARSHVTRENRIYSKLVDLEHVEQTAGHEADTAIAVERQDTLDRLLHLIRQLKPVDRQVILLYLDGLDGASIGEITGISAANVAVKISRIKAILARKFHEGQSHAK